MVLTFAVFLLSVLGNRSVSAFSASYLSSLNSGTTSGATTNTYGFKTQDYGKLVDSHIASSTDETMEGLISKQVSVELTASTVYMSASIWFRERKLTGMAAWMLEESDEERGHGKEILEFAMKSSIPVTLESLPAPPNHWQTPEQVWSDILALEQNNTKNLLKIASLANERQQFGVAAFLDPFHMEQIEAEDKVGAILAKVQGASESFLKELDHQLSLEAEEEDH